MMAGADYYACDVCGDKTFYDARIDWTAQHDHAIVAICGECRETHSILVVTKGKKPEFVFSTDRNKYAQEGDA